MHCKSLMILALSTVFATECFADDVKCRFLARRIIKVSNGIEYDDRPFANCRIYVFTLDAGGEYVEGAKPLTTDASGVASEPFDPTQVCFLYFAGRELSPTEREELKDNDGQMLLKFQAKLPQPEGSPFEVAKVGQDLKATALFSLPLWIAYLQRLEEELLKSHPKITAAEVLSKARQLFYEEDGVGSWDSLIDTNVDPVFTWDHDTGEITLKSDKVALETCEQLSNKYERSGLQYVLVTQAGQKQRNKLERFDHVSLRDGKTVMQIGHVLCGFESELTPPAPWLRPFLGNLDGVAATTWAGDLGQAGIEAERAAKAEKRPPILDEWKIAVAKKASSYDMAGDIIGAGNAETFRAAIEKKDASLSHELAKLLYDSKLPANSALGFVKRYGFNLKDKPIDVATKKQITSYVSRFAYFWAGKDWELGTLNENTKKRAAEYLESELRLLNTEFPALTLITPPLSDADFDGLTQAEEAKHMTDPAKRDTDGDGLWDGWEARQVVPVIGTKLDMADPLRLDIYVQVDFFKSAAADEEKLAKLKTALDLVVKAFERPRTGTFGDKGIRLHLEWQPEALPDVSPLEVKTLFGTPSAWDKLREQHFSAAKCVTHRHALLALKLSSGVGRAVDQALVVDVTPLADSAIAPEVAERIVAARFMRELGRTLGLSAGGLIQEGGGIVHDGTMFKPNHLSIMNDTWTEGIRRKNPKSGEIEWVLEYQDIDIKKDLNDIALYEPEGLGPLNETPQSAGYFAVNRGRNKDGIKYLPIHGGIDWNHDDDTNDGPIFENLNGVWWNVTCRGTLREWNRLKYSAGRIGSESYFFTQVQKLSPPAEESPEVP